MANNLLSDNRQLLSHELGHHWWGDIVTPYIHNDMWLKEGPAEYSGHLVDEWVYGHDQFITTVLNNQYDVLKNSHLQDGGFQPLSPMPDPYIYGHHTYYKGASVMHNLLGYLGDTLFRQAMSGVQAAFADTALDAADFGDALEQVTGTDLDPFFDAWVFAPGFSVFVVDALSAVPQGGSWAVDLTLRQRLRGTSTFHQQVPLDVTLIGAGWQRSEHQVLADGELTTVTLLAPFEPVMAVVNGHRRLNQARMDHEFVIRPGESFSSTLPRVDFRLFPEAVTDSALFRIVRALRLLLADGRIVECDRETNAGLFRATHGGMGLTGHILEVELTLQRVPSAWIVEERRRYDGLDELLAALRAAAAEWPYTVAWIDTLASGAALGRGILFAGRWAEAGEAPLVPPLPRPRRRFPVDLPEWCLSPFVVGLFNAVLFGTAPSHAKRRLLSPEQFFYPLDVIEDWNRMSGRRGFRQYQCVLPEGERPGATRRFLELMIELGGASFLSVLKDMGDEGEGMLSFPRPGVTVAVDLPMEVSTKDIEAAITIAQKTPAVCNRQECRVYVVHDKKLMLKMLAIQASRGFNNQINKLRVVTNKLTAFYGRGVRNQCWIDGGMFAMSLVLGLHAKGLGTCCLNWSKSAPEDRAMRRLLKLPPSEVIIMLVAVGHLPTDLTVARSVRQPFASARRQIFDESEI